MNHSKDECMTATALTIAGSDSGGGAGIQGDLKTFEALGVFGLSVLTSITAQNTQHVTGVYDLPPEFVALQWRTLVEDIRIDAVKTGMLSNRRIMEVLAQEIQQCGIKKLVVDPVMRAKSGDPLIAPEAEKGLREHILPLALVVTPNLPEAESLSGRRVRTLDDMKEAAKMIMEFHPQAVLIKGGHLEGQTVSIDILFDGRDFYEFSRERVEVPGGVHGTGCAYSAAITAELAKGCDLVGAVEKAKEYITQAIRRFYTIGRGHPVLDHSWVSVPFRKQ
jgi:hydroxymethylpyrimidine/phosphomethylpyrimidine kinase